LPILPPRNHGAKPGEAEINPRARLCNDNGGDNGKVGVVKRNFKEILLKNVCLLVVSTLNVLLSSSGAFAQAYAFIPNSGNDTVSVVDTSDDSVTATIELPEGSAPYAAAVLLDGSYAFIVNTGNNTVTVIDTSQITSQQDDLIEATISVGSAPRGIVVDPEGDYVYVTNYDSDTLSIINTGSYQVSTVDEVGDGPWGVLADPDGEHVYVVNNLDDSLTVISSNSTATVSDIGAGPVDIVHDEDRDLLYVTCADDDTLAVLEITYPDEDDDDDEITVSLESSIAVDLGPWGVALSPSNNYIYVSHATAGTVQIIDADDYDDRVSLTLDVDAGLRGIASAINGATMYVAGYETDTFYTIDMDTQTLGTSLSGFDTPVAMGQFIGGWPPDAPSGLEASDVDADSVLLEWDDNSWDESGFKIQRKDYDDDDDDYITVATVEENVTEYTNGGLSDEHSYTYRIVAYNEAGDSDPTDTVTITTETATGCFIGGVDRTARPRSGAYILSILGLLMTVIGHGLGSKRSGKVLTRLPARVTGRIK
jgi:YVTN family beta-propeller protein